MSDYRAVAAVTVALQQLLYRPATRAVPGAAVRTGPPSSEPVAGAPGLVNVFLYQVTPNPNWSNMDLPTRRADGSFINRPQVALDLHYLLSFHGDEARQVPQLLLGAVVTAIHAQPVLLPSDFPRELDRRSLADAGLEQQAQIIKFIQLPLTHDDLSKLWSVVLGVPYALSLAYRCSVVLMESDVVVQPSLPVVDYNVFVVPRTDVEIEGIEPQVVEHAEGAAVRLTGTNMSGGELRARVGDREVSPTRLPDGGISVELPAGLKAGVHTVRLMRRERLGNDTAAVASFESNPTSFVLLPRIAGPFEFGASPGEDGGESRRTVRVPVAPPIAPGQRTRLLLHQSPTPVERRPHSYQVTPGLVGPDGRSAEFPIDGVPAGNYLVQLCVDEVATRLTGASGTRDPGASRFDGPMLEIPAVKGQ